MSIIASIRNFIGRIFSPKDVENPEVISILETYDTTKAISNDIIEDCHIHIGQFFENYYGPIEIMDSIFSNNISRVYYSSTTSFLESAKYSDIEKEIDFVLKKYPSDKASPMLWYRPDYYSLFDSFDSLFDSIPYYGVKIHTHAKQWDTSNGLHVKILNELFEYTSEHDKPVLVHSGKDKVDEANALSQFYRRFPKTKFVLAHSRPIDQTLNLVNELDNMYCDSSGFIPLDSILQLKKNNVSRKLIIGSDFPVTHYYNPDKNISLEKQFKLDLDLLKKIIYILDNEYSNLN